MESTILWIEIVWLTNIWIRVSQLVLAALLALATTKLHSVAEIFYSGNGSNKIISGFFFHMLRGYNNHTSPIIYILTSNLISEFSCSKFQFVINVFFLPRTIQELIFFQQQSNLLLLFPQPSQLLLLYSQLSQLLLFFRHSSQLLLFFQ